MEIADFKKSLRVENLPIMIEKLIAFQNQYGFECYAEGFGLMESTKDGLETWCDHPDFLDALYPFAQANGSGSFYAFWKENANQSLDQMPIVIFGDEGGEHIVATNFKELLQILSYDAEASVDIDDVYYYRDQDDDHSEHRADFVSFLAELAITPSDHADAIVQAARTAKEKDWVQWSIPFIDPDAELLTDAPEIASDVAPIQSIFQALGKKHTDPMVISLLDKYKNTTKFPSRIPVFEFAIAFETFGFDLIFNPSLEEKALCLKTIQCYIDGYTNTYTGFSEELPYGLKLNNTPEELISILGEPEKTFMEQKDETKLRAHIWVNENMKIVVNYKENKVQVIAFGIAKS